MWDSIIAVMQALGKGSSHPASATKIRILCVVLVCWPLTGCSLFTSESEKVLQEAKAGLAGTVTTIPRYEELELIHQAEELFSSRVNDWKDGPCKYARGMWVFGTDMPSSEVLERYARDMTEQGWRSRDNSTPATWALSLVRNKHEHAEIYSIDSPTGEPSIFVRGIMGYEKQVSKYATFVVVSVGYVVPQLEGC